MKKLWLMLAIMLSLIWSSAAAQSCNHNFVFHYGYTQCARNAYNDQYCDKQTVKAFRCTKCVYIEYRGSGWSLKDHKRGASGCNFN